jgi:hypothetical protein
MNYPQVACLILALLTASGYTTTSKFSEPVSPTQSSAEQSLQPEKDCRYFQELAYGLQESVKSAHTKIITEDFINRWTYVVMNNAKCFTQIEYCDAIDMHNSVSPWGKQESPPNC